MKKTAFALCLLALFSSALAGLDLPQLDVLNLRSRGMGGVGLGFADDQYTPINNPAGMALMRTKYVTILKAQAVISGDFLKAWEYKDEIKDIIDGDYNIANDTWNYISNLRVSAGSTPLYLSLLNIFPLNINLIIFNTARVRVKTNPDMLVPTWNVDVFNDTVAMLNWGFNLIDFKYMNIYIGINAKLIHRVMYSRERMDVFSIYNYFSMSLEDYDLMRALSVGGDLGLMAELGHARRVRLGITMTDFYGSRFNWVKLDLKDLLGVTLDNSGTEMIEPALNVGLSIRVGTIIPLFIEDLVLGIDVRNILDRDVNFFLKTHAGLEFRFLKFLKVRAGLYQGWLTAGGGIDIPLLPLEINFAYWAEELGDYPGQQRLDNFGVTLNFMW